MQLALTALQPVERSTTTLWKVWTVTCSRQSQSILHKRAESCQTLLTILSHEISWLSCVCVGADYQLQKLHAAADLLLGHISSVNKVSAYGAPDFQVSNPCSSLA